MLTRIHIVILRSATYPYLCSSVGVRAVGVRVRDTWSDKVIGSVSKVLRVRESEKRYSLQHSRRTLHVTVCD